MGREKTQWIMGVHAILEALRSVPEQVDKIFLSPGKEKSSSLNEILNRAETEGISVATVGKKNLESMVHSPHHQGVVACVQPANLLALPDLLEQIPQDQPSLLLLLDSLYDPQNLGSLYRLAEGFGLHGMIWSKNRGCDLTPAVSKASAGASLLVPSVRVSNLANAYASLQEAGYHIGVSILDEEAKDAFHHPLPKRLALVLGSEGEGVRPLLVKKADGKWVLPLQGKLQSLNVGQAAVAFASLWRKNWYGVC